MDREPVEQAPDRWRGEFKGHHIAHGKPPIPITVHVEWVDGREGELDGWTSQWTRTQCASCVASSPAGSGRSGCGLLMSGGANPALDLSRGRPCRERDEIRVQN